MVRIKQWTKFNGKRYEAVGITDNIASASKLQNELKNSGYKTKRVELQGRNNKRLFALYKRRK